MPDLRRTWTAHLLAPLKSPSFPASHLSLLSSRGALRDFPTQMFPVTLMCFSVHLHPGRRKPEAGPGTHSKPPSPPLTPTHPGQQVAQLRGKNQMSAGLPAHHTGKMDKRTGFERVIVESAARCHVILLAMRKFVALACKEQTGLEWHTSPRWAVGPSPAVGGAPPTGSLLK